MQVPCDHLATRLRPSQIVDDLLRVRSIAKRTGRRGRTAFFTMTLADGTGPVDAIAGTKALTLVPGQTVRVRGCVLVRRGRPILVISRLRPHINRRLQ